MNILNKLLSPFQPKPSPEFVAQQLRKPSGKFALKVAEKMNQSNEFLYDLTLETMELKEKESILEIGFGNGKFFNKIFSQAKGLNISGIDYSEEMVKAAKANNKEKFVLGKIHLVLGNSNNLPFAHHCFNKVFGINVIYFWDKPEDHLKEIHRVLKPKGKFYTSIRTKETMQNLPFTPFGFKLYEVEEWVTVLEDNGFEVIQTNIKEDPVKINGGNTVSFESACIVAEKVG